TDDSKFLAELGLVRWIGDDFAPATIHLRPNKALYVVPAYPLPDMQLFGAQNEVDILKKTFGAVAVDPADSDTVIEILSDPDSFDLLHFACHGAANQDQIWDAGVLMTGEIASNGDYVEDPLDAEVVGLDANMRRPDHTRPMVFLNACQAGKAGASLSGTGGMARAFIMKGAGLFVGTLWSIGDDTSLTFAEVFYEEMKRGRTVTQASQAARAASREADEPTWLAYTVYGHPYARLQIDK
ncbi:MAG: CHAT domain-containing protein, partial [Rhodobiaceae bacterium]|nr:CHAT domain-containing protein [Rhodobiaceae bacterium]